MSCFICPRTYISVASNDATRGFHKCLADNNAIGLWKGMGAVFVPFDSIFSPLIFKVTLEIQPDSVEICAKSQKLMYQKFKTFI